MEVTVLLEVFWGFWVYFFGGCFFFVGGIC